MLAYLPDLRVSAGLSLNVIPDFRVLPTAAFVNRRVPDVTEHEKLGGYADVSLRGEYSVLNSVMLFVDCKNLTNSNYEEWKGYRALPLVLTGGVAVRW